MFDQDHIIRYCLYTVSESNNGMIYWDRATFVYQEFVNKY